MDVTLIMKKIICLIGSLGSGGAERQMSGLAVLLKKQGYDVEVWTYYPNDFYLPTLQSANVTYRYIAEAQNKKSRVKVLRRELKKANPDTVIAYLDTACMVACIIKALGARFRLIVSERNTTQNLSKREQVKFFLYRFADYVVPNSHSQADFICNKYPKLKAKVRTITNFVDTEYFRPATKQDFSNTRTNTVVVVGSHKPQKNFHRFVDAIKILQGKEVSIRIKWYGIFPEYIDEFRKYVSETGLDKEVEVYGPTQNIREVYQSADFFCLPSLFEGFPNVLCEAISTGLPIACSNVCDNPYILKEVGVGLLFNPLNVEDMADKLQQLVGMSDEEWQNVSTTSRCVAENIFSKKSFVEKYSKLI